MRAPVKCPHCRANNNAPGPVDRYCWECRTHYAAPVWGWHAAYGREPMSNDMLPCVCPFCKAAQKVEAVHTVHGGTAQCQHCRTTVVATNWEYAAATAYVAPPQVSARNVSRAHEIGLELAEFNQAKPS